LTVIISLVAGCGFHSAAPDAGPDAGACDGPCAPVTLAAGLVLPVDVAVNDRQVYWLEYGGQNQGLCGTVNRVGKLDGCPQADAGCVDQIAWERFQVAAMALGDSDVCWIEFYPEMREIHCLALATGAIRKMVDNRKNTDSIVIDSGNIVFADAGSSRALADGQIAQVPLGAGPTAVTTLVSGRPEPTTVAADAAGLYWGEDGKSDATGAVWAAARDGSGVRPLASGQRGPRSLRVAGDYVYWTNELSGEVMRVRRDGSAQAETIASAQSAPIALVVDSDSVYWLDYGTPPNRLDGVLMRAALDGSGAAPLATGIPTAAALAVDDQFVYWVNQGTEQNNYLDGYLRKIRKQN
jgi:hypothetical protein